MILSRFENGSLFFSFFRVFSCFYFLVGTFFLDVGGRNKNKIFFVFGKNLMSAGTLNDELIWCGLSTVTTNLPNCC